MRPNDFRIGCRIGRVVSHESCQRQLASLNPSHRATADHKENEELMNPEDPNIEVRPHGLIFTAKNTELEKVGSHESNDQPRSDLHGAAMPCDLAAARAANAEKREAA